MRKYLIVANQTLPGAALRDELKKRIEAGPSSFYVLVPNTSAAHYHSVPAAGGVLPMPSMVLDYGAPASDTEASELAQRRLDQLLASLTELGVEVDGSLGSAHPIQGIEDILGQHTFDEIIVATLPRRVSRWLRADVPHRAERRFGLPVTTIITEH